MYNIPKQRRTTIEINDSVEGEPIEIKMERLINNKDETSEGKELLFTRKEDGIVGTFDVRHDHWDDAVEDASTMAEKRSEMDAATLEKRIKMLKQKAEEENFLKEQAKKGLEGGQDNPKGEV